MNPTNMFSQRLLQEPASTVMEYVPPPASWRRDWRSVHADNWIDVLEEFIPLFKCKFQVVADPNDEATRNRVFKAQEEREMATVICHFTALFHFGYHMLIMARFDDPRVCGANYVYFCMSMYESDEVWMNYDLQIPSWTFSKNYGTSLGFQFFRCLLQML
jgi:hypothetical protein